MALVAGAVLGVNVALIVVLSGLVGIPLFAARVGTAEAAGAGAR